MSGEERKQISSAHYEVVRTSVNALLPLVTQGAACGFFVEIVTAGRPVGQPGVAGMIAVISGEFSDADLARFRDFCGGMIQDGRPRGATGCTRDSRNFDHIAGNPEGDQS